MGSGVAAWFRRRPLLITAALFVLVAIVWGAFRLVPVLAIAVAYKAKVLCSGVFVSRRAEQDVLADLESDDLRILAGLPASIDWSAKSVTARGLGFLRRRAVHREGRGCVLVFGGQTPAPSPARETGPAGRTPIESASVGHPKLEAALDRAFSEPDPSRLRRTRAVVVVHQGRIVAERYSAGVTADTPLAGWSMTKSVLNALVGVLVKERRLSIDARVPLAEWQRAGDPRGRITLDHLLRMSSGLQFDEDMSNPLADVIYMLLAVPDMAAYAAGKRLEHEPGTSWHYASGSSLIVSRAIREVLANDEEYLAFPHRALFDPIGMTGATIETDAAGTFVASSFMYATARDWAAFGLLYLQDGVWSGRRILPEGWVAYTRSPAPADSSRRYGAHFWLDVPEYGKAGGLPPDAFHAAGHEAQFVTIVPSRQLVIVRLGRTRYADGWDHVAFVRDVLEAVGPS